MGLFSKLKDSMAKVQQENRENTRVKTAPTEIFDRIRNKIEDVQKEQATKKAQNKGRSLFDILKRNKKMRLVQQKLLLTKVF